MKVSKAAGSDELWLGDKFPKELPVHLTDKEREERAKEMSGAQIELTGLEEEKKEAMKDFGARMKPLQQLVKNLAPVVNTGIEQRPVPVRWRQELGGTSAVLVRMDTFEVLEDSRRALNPAELDGLQATMGFGRSEAPPPEEIPSALLDEVLSAGNTPGRAVKAQSLNRATADYRKAPANANRGVEMCATEEEHEYGKPNTEGWESCRKCPADRRLVATATLYEGPELEPQHPVASLTDMGEEDLSASQAALDELEAGPKPPSVRWPLGDTMWMLSIDGDQLWFHSPDLASSSSRRHGPAGWAPEAHGTDRIVAWGGDLGEVPLIIIAAAVALLDKGAEGLVLPRPMAEVKAAIAAERAKDMESWKDEQHDGQTREDTAARAPAEVPGADLTDLAAAFLVALLDGPLTLDAIRSKTNNRRPGTTANHLMEKGFVEQVDADDVAEGSYKLTPTGQQTADLLKKAKESRTKGTRKA